MTGRRLAYLCLQATTEGQASHAHVHEIIDGLVDLGWDVELYQPTYAGGRAPGPLGRVSEFATVQRRLVRALREGRHDAVYVRGHQLAWYASRAARRLGVPVVQEVNGPFADFYAVWTAARPAAALLDALARSQYRWADARIAVTRQLADWVRSETGREAVVIGNGANDRLFTPTARSAFREQLPERYAVFFGALSPWQGVDLMLAAVRAPEWPLGIRLVLAGDGVEGPKVRSAAESGAAVLPLGTVPYAELPGIVAGASASLVLSKRPDDVAGLSPLKMYESMACGVPLVVLDLPGTADTVRTHQCGLVAEETASSVAAAVARIMADPEEARAMGSRGRAAVEAHYSWRARAAATDAVLRAVAGERTDD